MKRLSRILWLAFYYGVAQHLPNMGGNPARVIRRWGPAAGADDA